MLKPVRRHFLKACWARLPKQREKVSERTILRPQSDRSLEGAGFSLVELMLVVAVIGIMTAISVPKLISSRRLQRSAALPTQIMGQLRVARQQAMSHRRAVTFQYDDGLRRVRLIKHATVGPAVLTEANYPNTVGSIQISLLVLAGSSVPEMVYGIPPNTSTAILGDGTTLTPLSASRQINITFQPDGSVVDVNGQPSNFALYFYNGQLPKETATAVSVLGSAGRVRIWRYSENVSKFTD